MHFAVRDVDNMTKRHHVSKKRKQNIKYKKRTSSHAVEKRSATCMRFYQLVITKGSVLEACMKSSDLSKNL